jgi:hypothetical protein
MDALDRYELLTEPDEKGYVMVKRLADGKLAPCKAAWLKAAPGDGLAQVPRSRVKAIRLAGLDWE